MIHGHCRTSDDGQIWLGFSDRAPIFAAQAKDKPTKELVVATKDDIVVGYTVVRENEGHGFLFYPKDKEQAEREAISLTAAFAQPYVCLPLTIRG